MSRVKILMTEFVTHDVKRFILEKPNNIKFEPGQAVKMSIDEKGWIDKKRPFTFTGLPSDKVLEFTIKGYFNHDGVTQKLHSLSPGAGLILEKPFGTINFAGNGVFIAGGAGITPFISIIRDLKKRNNTKGNTLIFSNKTGKDIILEKELKDIFSEKKLFLTLTRQKMPGYYQGRVNREFLEKNISDFSQNFYFCGPYQMVVDLKKVLTSLGATEEKLVYEEGFING